MEIGGGLYTEQKQAMSAGQVQSLNVLALTNQELEDFLMNEYLENPMLENTGDKENEMITDVEKLYERGSSFRDLYLSNPDGEETPRSDVRAKQEAPLKEYLLSQLDQGSYPERTWNMMGYLIDCLDEKGYLSAPVEELAGPYGYQAEELRACLEELKELEPAGIFSKDLAECLERQLLEKGIQDETLFRLLRESFTDLMNGQLGAISRKLGISTVKVKEYLHLISTLNPRPVMDVSQDDTEYVVPDILVARHGGQWEVTINDSWMGEYRLNDYYLRLMEESQDPELTAYFKERLERARFVIGCVEQRRRTIVRIVEAVLALQEEYFEGTGPLKPMQQETVAGMLDIHVSTVSRAVKGKYIQYKQCVPLRSLFTAAVSESGGAGGVSAEEIRQRIRALIAGEGSQPLSDQRLTELLAEEGITVSRRAVAKYRMQMNLPDSRQRGMVK